MIEFLIEILIIAATFLFMAMFAYDKAEIEKEADEQHENDHDP